MDEKYKTNVKPVTRDQGKHQYGIHEDNRSLYNLTQIIVSCIFLEKVYAIYQCVNPKQQQPLAH
jgi:hypothetical protein